MRFALLVLIIWLLCQSCCPAEAWTGRRAVLFAEAQVMLAENAPWVPRRSDCSAQMWRLLNKTFPELRIHKWFRRDTAHAMGQWPWEPVMRLEDLYFGDLLWSGWPRLKHVMMSWVEPRDIIHASKSRGFVKDALRPYWAPRITLIVRPPY